MTSRIPGCASSAARNLASLSSWARDVASSSLVSSRTVASRPRSRIASRRSAARAACATSRRSRTRSSSRNSDPGSGSTMSQPWRARSVSIGSRIVVGTRMVDSVGRASSLPDRAPAGRDSPTAASGASPSMTRTIGGSPRAMIAHGPLVIIRAVLARPVHSASTSSSLDASSSAWPMSNATARCCKRRIAMGGRNAARYPRPAPRASSRARKVTVGSVVAVALVAAAPAPATKMPAAKAIVARPAIHSRVRA